MSPDRAAAFDQLTRLPVVIEHRRGERIPVELVLDSSLLELEASELALVAKRDCYLLLRPDGGPLLSADGIDFEADHEPKNYFFFGFKVQRDQATAMRVVLGVRAEQGPQAR